MVVASKAKRSAAAKKAARTRKLNTISQNMFAKDFGKLTKKQKSSVKKESKKGGVKKSARKKTKRRSYKFHTCKRTHDVSNYYAAQKIAMSEGLWQKKLEKTIGRNGFAFPTGTAMGVFDIGTYKKNKKLEFYEIKPKISKPRALLKPEQKKWALDWMKLITTKLVYYDEKKFVFYHSKPILLTKKNIEQYSQPFNQKKVEEIQKISCTKLFSDKRAERYCRKELTGHSVKIIRKIGKLRR